MLEIGEIQRMIKAEMNENQEEEKTDDVVGENQSGGGTNRRDKTISENRYPYIRSFGSKRWET